MLPSDDTLYLYNLTLRLPSLAPHSIVGLFSGQKKAQELVLATATTIELHRPNFETGKVEKVMTQRAFANVQGIDTIRLVGTHKDLLVVSSDSGKIIVAEYKEGLAKFVPVVQEPHSKNGLRRITPGEYLSVNPKNRALMVGAIERNKLVYKVEMENVAGLLELLSPLEVSNKNVLTLQLCALDTAYENPVWAAIEVDYKTYENRPYSAATSPLLLNYYELDQGLNHVVTRRSKPDLPASANLLVPLPGHVGGVLVCCNSYLIYEKSIGAERIYLPLPIRERTTETVIVNFFVHTLRKNDFFILLQSSIGDLFKVTVDFDADAQTVERFLVTYFDSIPACNTINVLKSGFLFANTTDNNKLFYQFENLGDTNETTLVSTKEEKSWQDPTPFKPVGLQNLALVDIIESLTPLVDGVLYDRPSTDNNNDLLRQLVTLSSHSYMKVLTYGLPTSELVSLPLPIVPTSIYTTKTTSSSVSDDYLVLTTSLSSKTLVLSIGEVVEEVSDSGFVVDQYTLGVQQMGKDSIAQIHSNGIRHIKHTVDSESGEILSKKQTDWYPPAGINVIQASSNNEQIIIGLSNRDVCYFEIDQLDEQLIEYQERFEVSGGSITAICLTTGFVNDTRKSNFAIIASSDETIQVLSLLAHNCFDVLSLQALSATCSSLLMLPMNQDTLYVHMGLVNGIYVRVNIDMMSGRLSDTRLKYLGTKPVQIRSLALPGLKQSALLLLSSRPWVGFFNVNNSFKVTPLLGTNIISGTSFYSEDIGSESVVGISEGNLTIFTIGNDESGGFNPNNEFTTEQIKLRYSPRKQIKDSKSSTFFVAESEFGTVSPYSVENAEVDSDYYDAFGYERKSNNWASCLQVIDVLLAEVTQSIELENNECISSICQLKLGEGDYLIVGTVVDQQFSPPSSSDSFLYTFVIKRPKKGPVSLELLHKTSVDKCPSALTLFNGRLLACLGNELRLYELGKKQLLRKSLTSVNYLRRVTKVVHEGGDIILVGDSNESVSYLKFDTRKNCFTPFCNDVMKRQITAFEPLDNRTVVGGDKFGNIFVSRIPSEVAEQLTDNVLVNHQENFLGASGSRLTSMCEFYFGDIATSFQKGTFVVGGTESVIYTGIEGTVGLLIPVATKHDSEFLLKLESLLRKHYDVCFEDSGDIKSGANLVGREHLKFRGYYNPVKNVIDGDFVETFYELDESTKVKLAGQLDRTPKEVEGKIYNLRNRAAF